MNSNNNNENKIIESVKKNNKDKIDEKPSKALSLKAKKIIEKYKKKK